MESYTVYFPLYDFEKARFETIDNKLLVFQEEDSVWKKDMPAELFNLVLKNLHAYYVINNGSQNSFLHAKELGLSVLKPLESAFAYDLREQWRFKDEVNLTKIEDLQMDLNLGGLDIVSLIVKGNNKEDSEVYPYLKDVFEKIMMEVDVGDLDIEMETLEVLPERMNENFQEIVYKNEQDEYEEKYIENESKNEIENEK